MTLFTLLLFAQVTLVPGTAMTYTDGVNTWAGSPFCNQVVDPNVMTTCVGHTGPITALLCPDSPAIDHGAFTEIHCNLPGSALDQPTLPDGSYCVEWYGYGPDIGACEFVPLTSVKAPNAPASTKIE